MLRSPWRIRYFAVLLVAIGNSSALADDRDPAIEAALARAGDNRGQIERALESVPEAQRDGMRFVVTNMPERDLTSLSAEFLLQNSDFAYRAWEQASWKDAVPKDIFLNDVLPYASINERRDPWRPDFFRRFRPLVKDAKSPTEAAVILNQKIFAELNVRYSTKRPKPDQSPYESMEAGLASCTGLSVLLIDACRAVGVPARFVGTPLWSDRSGNHSWVEIWDDGWHFTGAAEPAGNELDRAWFIGRASTARRDHPHHAIYAASFKRTPQRFPVVWARNIDYVFAVNVTDRYTRLAEKLPAGVARAMFRVLDKTNGQRMAANLKITDAEGQVVFEGRTNDERFDANDHMSVPLKIGGKYDVEIRVGGQTVRSPVHFDKPGQLFSFFMKEPAAGARP